MSELDNFRLPELQKYLKARGVTVTGYNKGALKDIAKAVENLNLPVDPDFCQDSVLADIKRKVSKARLPDINPLDLKGYTSDFTYIPEFGLIDIFNYLIFNKSEYDGKKLKAYKSFEDYRLFYDGHVQSLQFNPVSDSSDVCVFKAEVKPTQRDKTYMNKDVYSLWFVMDKDDGCVITGHCECIGGADGACRHLAASLFELEAFEIKSCTEGENQWQKRARNHDTPVPLRQLSLVKAKYGGNEKTAPQPFSDIFDPRTEGQREAISTEDIREFGLNIQHISQQTQVLDVILHPDDLTKSTEIQKMEDIRKFSIVKLAEQFKSEQEDAEFNEQKCEEFYNSICHSSSDTELILESTKGQSSNDLWFEMRKGILTASNFQQACNYIDDDRPPSKTFMNSVLGTNRLEESMLPAPLKWGRQKEHIARNMYQRCERRKHTCLRVHEKGLFISDKYPVLGCSVDGICSCKCKTGHPSKIVEIKCPFSQRLSNPKDAGVKAKCVYDKEAGVWTVMSSCPYYAQIQGQLGLYGMEEADLVIFTKFGIHIATVKYDEKYFSEMVDKLISFHKKYIIPELIK